MKKTIGLCAALLGLMLPAFGAAAATASSSPIITSLSPSSGPVGTLVGVNGTNLTDSNYVFINGFPEVGPLSAKGGLDFPFPSKIDGTSTPVTAGMYFVAVKNEFGTTNALPFTVTSASIPTISVSSPSAGQSVLVGQPLTISWADSREKGIPPQYLLAFIGNNDKGTIGTAASSSCSSGSCSLTWTVEPTTASTAYVSVCDIANDPSRVACGSSGTFSVTSVSPIYSQPPAISSIAPSNGPVGTRVILSGTGFVANSSVIFWGTKVDTAGNGIGTQLSFVVPSIADNSFTNSSYGVKVQNQYGTSNTVYFSLTNGTSPMISSIYPTSGPVGTRVIINTNFPLDPTRVVVFNGQALVSGYDPDTSTEVGFTIPSVAPGAYAIRVGLAPGNETNSVNFSVTDSVASSTPPTTPSIPPVVPPSTPPATSPSAPAPQNFTASCSAAPAPENTDGTPGAYKIGDAIDFVVTTNPAADPVSGQPAYSYQWIGQPSDFSNYNYVTYNSAGTKTVKVRVTDPALKGKSRTVNASCSVTIAKKTKPVSTKPAAPFALSCSADLPTVALPNKPKDRTNVTITFTAAPSVPGSYSYAWTGPGISGDSSSGTATGSWKNPGTHTARVKATDTASGKSKTASCFSKFAVASVGSAAIFDAFQSYWNQLWH